MSKKLNLFGPTKPRKVAYREKYVKDTLSYNPNGRKELQTQINIAERIFAVECGKYEDGKEYLIIKIDGL